MTAGPTPAVKRASAVGAGKLRLRAKRCVIEDLLAGGPETVFARCIAVVIAVLSLVVPPSQAQLSDESRRPVRRGRLTDDRIIASEVLGYRLQYRVYLPPGYKKLEQLPVIYLTDGQSYISAGELPALIDRLIAAGEVVPLIAVFVDGRDPDNLRLDRRNAQFFCNPAYAQFFEEELVPAIDRDYKTRASRSGRVILGLSFGGLNAACFGIQAYETFGGLAMQSPAFHPVPAIYDVYRDEPQLELRIFVSSGTQGDNLQSTRRFKEILASKGYDLRYREVDEGHDWRNWKPLLDDVLIYFFAPSGK